MTELQVQEFLQAMQVRLLERFNHLDAKIDNLSDRVQFMDQRLIAVEAHIATLITMLPAYNTRLDHLEERLSKVEKRLQLQD